MLTIDVRPLLKAGSEPLSAIIQAKSQLAPGQSLQLLAPFEPKPLYAMFESEGYKAQPRKLDSGDWEILFSTDTNDLSNRKELDFRGQSIETWLEQALEATSYLGREDTMTLRSSERPSALLSKLNSSTTDFDSEAEDECHWVTTIWRL